MANSAFTVGGGATPGTVSQVIPGVGLTSTPNPIVGVGTMNVNLNSLCQGRLTLTSGLPVTITDVNNVGTIYFCPYLGNYVSLYTAGAWRAYQFTEVALAAPAGVAQMYDIFLYDNAGVLTLVTEAWATSQARAVALAIQDGVYVHSVNLNYRYLGSFCTLAANQITDSTAYRHVWNYYNRVLRTLDNYYLGSWTYNVSTYRVANNDLAHKLDVVCGIAEDVIQARINSMCNSTSTSGNQGLGFGINSTTVNSSQYGAGINYYLQDVGVLTSTYTDFLPIGRTLIYGLEIAGTGGSSTFYGQGTINGVPYQLGIDGEFLM